MERRTKTKAKVSGVDVVFRTVEDFISQKLRLPERDRDQKRGRKRKLNSKSEGNPNLVSVYTPEWREAVIRFAQNMPIDLLIRQFNQYYGIKMLPAGTCVEDATAIVQKGKEKKDEGIHIPADIMMDIFFRLRLPDLLVCRTVSRYWASIYASANFQGMCTSSEKCIVINNHNLDIWVFSPSSKSWFLLKIPCDWDKLGMKTLGIKASNGGLYLVARSDCTLHVFNPLTAEMKTLPKISPPTRNRVQLLNHLILHGTAEIQNEYDTCHFKVYLFDNWHRNGNSCVHLARYCSRTELWTIKPICPYLSNIPIPSSSFPSPLSSYIFDNIIMCFSATYQHFYYLCDNPLNNNEYMPYGEGLDDMVSHFPETIQMEKRYGEPCCNNGVALPTVIPLSMPPSTLGMVFVGRVQQSDGGKQIYGRLPIVSHTDICLWAYNPMTIEWSMIDIIPVAAIESMIKSSEGTDYIVVGNWKDDIWLMLRGSKSMLHYKIGIKKWELEPGCPGGGYMDAHIRWRATFDHLVFYAKVNEV